MLKHSMKEIQDESSPAKKSRFSIDGILGSSKNSTMEPSPSSLELQEAESDPEESAPASAPKGNWIPPGTSPKLSVVVCKLEGKELWSKFYDLSTEMIITKSGRRMFPTVKIKLENCAPESLYYVFLDVIPVDDRRYRYVYNKSSWLTAGKAEPAPESRIYMHPDSPFPGRQLGAQVISFEKAKLTNSDVDRTGHLVLNSMHKYQPRVHVVRRERTNPIQNNKVDLRKEDYKTFVFTETQFMAVTAYQNQLITKLKIEKNPFAKGFRDPSGRSSEMDLERHLERLPRFPFNAMPNPAAAAAFMLGQFPGFPFAPGPPNQPPTDWFFANLAAVFNNPMNPGPVFPKFPFLPNLPHPIPKSPTSPSSTQNDEATEVDIVNEEDPSTD